MREITFDSACFISAYVGRLLEVDKHRKIRTCFARARQFVVNNVKTL